VVNKGLAIGIGIAAIATLFLATRAEAAGEYVCPYDGLIFPTLAELQDHVMAVHPEERIPISIRWS
jgi:hypothetical protein